MSNLRLEFYFDYLSPYAYFAWINVNSFCAKNRLELVPKPVVFGKLLDHWGQLGPAEIPPKRQWLGKYCLLYAAKHNIPLKFPKYHPFKSITPLRLSLAQVCGEHQHQIINTIFNGSWGQGGDMGNTQEVEQLLNTKGLPGSELIQKTNQEWVKDALKSATAAAIENGVFGVPTMILDDELFWGNDQFDFMQELVDNREQFKATTDRSRSATERAIDRKAFLDWQNKKSP